MNDNVEINSEIAKKLFELGDMPNGTELSNDSFLMALNKIKTTLNPEDNTPFSPTSNNILIVDDIGVVTYQLKILFKNLGYNVQVAKDIFTGLNTFVKSNYAFVIMDLFVSTEQEGYTLLHETKKIITKSNLGTKIIVITASNKAENKVKCLNGGADFFLKKDAGWQDKLVELIESVHNKENM